jgi:hypothetical protein
MTEATHGESWKAPGAKKAGKGRKAARPKEGAREGRGGVKLLRKEYQPKPARASFHETLFERLAALRETPAERLPRNDAGRAELLRRVQEQGNPPLIERFAETKALVDKPQKTSDNQRDINQPWCWRW